MKYLLIIKFLFEFLRNTPTFKPKVFVIGYNKTGTTSCGVALKEMGFRNLSFNKLTFWLYKKKYFKALIKIASRFDSFDDIPWNREELIPIMDKNFPNSKFIYLDRDLQTWEKSYINWRKKIFKKETNDIEKKKIDFLNHKSFCLKYFENRPNDMIVIRIQQKNELKKLSDFINVKTKKYNFPHLNKT